MSDHQPPRPTIAHRDRGTVLVFLGAVEILIGLVCAAFIPLTLVGVAFSPVIEAGMVASSLALYGALATIFVILGIGSIRARCWAQALTLSLSWVWLITGVCSMVFLWLVMPGLWRDLGASAGLQIGDARIIAIGINLFLVVIYVVLPGLFVLVYRSPDVIATCRLRDPDPGWTGRCPQQLLSLTVAYGLGGLGVISVPSYGYVFPFFGSLLSGPAGAACWAAVVTLCGALAWGTCHRRPWAWWTAMVTGVIAGLSSAWTFAVIDPNELFRIEGLLADQRWLFESVWPTSPWVHVAIHSVIWGSFLVYLALVRPLFDPPLGRGDAEG